MVSRELIKDGEIQWEAMRKSTIAKEDLIQALREQAALQDPADVKYACLERGGTITVIPRNRDSQVFEIAVKDGVQTVSIEIGSTPQKR